MKKGLFSIFILFCSILVACSSDLDSNESRDDMANISVDEESASEMADFGSELYSVENDQQDIEQKEEYNETNNKEISNQVERKVIDRKSTRLNSSHVTKSYAVFCMIKRM